MWLKKWWCRVRVRAEVEVKELVVMVVEEVVAVGGGEGGGGRACG